MWSSKAEEAIKKELADGLAKKMDERLLKAIKKESKMARKPKTCWGCRSLFEHPFLWAFYCGLYYTVQIVGNDPVPQEPCPKPRTWAEWGVAKDKNNSKG